MIPDEAGIARQLAQLERRERPRDPLVADAARVPHDIDPPVEQDERHDRDDENGDEHLDERACERRR